MSSVDPLPAPARGLPSIQAGSARSTLLNALGEFALQGRAQTPTTGALVRTLAEVGVNHHAARQAVQRCSTGGWITGLRSGRESQWAITTKGRELLADGIARVEELSVDSGPDGWDGRWLIVVGFIPTEQRTVRERFYRHLRWNGFGSPMPGLWLSARQDRRSRMADAVRRCGLESTVTAFVGTSADVGMNDTALVEQAWDLNEIAERYRNLLTRVGDVAAKTPAECMRALLELDQELQFAPSWDPHLPTALVPPSHHRHDVTRLLDLRSQWLEPARARWDELQG